MTRQAQGPSDDPLGWALDQADQIQKTPLCKLHNPQRFIDEDGGMTYLKQDGEGWWFDPYRTTKEHGWYGPYATKAEALEAARSFRRNYVGNFKPSEVVTGRKA